MKIAYLMQVHRNPRLLQRAVQMLSLENCAFFVHVDRKSDIGPFSAINGHNVSLVERRIPVYWGEFSQVEATMLLLREALASPAQYDYFVFLQGSDYPLRSSRYIQGFLEKHRGCEFINLAQMPAPGYSLSKINKLRYPSDKPVRRFATRVLAKCGFPERDYRKYLGGLEAYAGQAWWTLSRDASTYIVEFAACNPHVKEYFQNAFTSDEMFFHTILGNSRFRHRVRRGLTYIDWPAPGDHPEMLNAEHIKLFEAQDKVWIEDEWGSGEALFARKFSDENLELVDRIDEIIRQKEEASAHFQASIPNSADSQRASKT